MEAQSTVTNREKLRHHSQLNISFFYIQYMSFFNIQFYENINFSCNYKVLYFKLDNLDLF